MRRELNFDDESEFRHEQPEANNSHARIEPDCGHIQLASDVSEKDQEGQGSQIMKQSFDNPSTLPSHNSKHSESIEKQQEQQHTQQAYYHEHSSSHYLPEVRPNLLMGNGNSSPIPQSNQTFTMKPHQPEPEYDPYKKSVRAQQLKNAQARKTTKKTSQEQQESQIQPVSRKRSRRPPSMSSNRRSNNIISLHDQSTIVFKAEKPQIAPSQQAVVEDVSQHLHRPMTSTTAFELVRDCTFGVNYLHPDFTIKGSDGVPVISAKKQYCHLNSYYSITAGRTELGCLKGNFGGSEFNLYRFRQGHEELVTTIAYKTNLTCSSEFRKMEVFIKNQDRHDLMFDAEAKRKSLQELYQQGYRENIRVIRTKQPTWNEKSQCFTMNFGGKGKLPSIKNMILTSSSPYPALLFCKSSKDTFHLQLASPLTLFSCMGVLMSSFDFKLFCQ